MATKKVKKIEEKDEAKITKDRTILKSDFFSSSHEYVRHRYREKFKKDINRTAVAATKWRSDEKRKWLANALENAKRDAAVTFRNQVSIYVQTIGQAWIWTLLKNIKYTQLTDENWLPIMENGKPKMFPYYEDVSIAKIASDYVRTLNGEPVRYRDRWTQDSPTDSRMVNVNFVLSDESEDVGTDHHE